jgi:uncharacterized membrane protein
MLITWVATIAVMWRIQHPLWDDILTMGFTQLFVGRAAAIAQATQIDLSPALTILLATFVDLATVFILYPVLVLSYRSLFEGRFYKKHMQPVFAAATRNMDKFSKYKVAGIFLFVWFPFWGTGVVAGAILGYLMRVRLWVTMLTVALGTLTAVICWVFAYNQLFAWLGGIHESIPLLVTFGFIAGLIAWRFVRGHRNHRGDS